MKLNMPNGDVLDLCPEEYFCLLRLMREEKQQIEQVEDDIPTHIKNQLDKIWNKNHNKKRKYIKTGKYAKKRVKK